MPVIAATPPMFLPLAYRPFLDPLPAWGVWYLLALPLIAGVSVVYKSIRSRAMKNIVWESTRTFLWIVFGLCGAAADGWLLVCASTANINRSLTEIGARLGAVAVSWPGVSGFAPAEAAGSALSATAGGATAGTSSSITAIASA